MEPSRSTSPSVHMVAEGERVKKPLEHHSSFHQGGTIEDITRQISELDTSLHDNNQQSQLVIDKYLKEKGLQYEEEEEEFGYGKLVIDYKPPKPLSRDRILNDKEQEAKELKKFAGLYSVRTALQPSSHDPLEKNLAMKWKGSTSKKKAEKSSGMKPMLVELHVFPGYEQHELTPLPPPLLVKEILDKVVNAQPDLKRKIKFKKYLVSLLTSKMSEAVTQDIFWWYFLDKYQPNTRIQELMFNRIAHNYVKLLFMAPMNEFRDTFFKRFPNLVTQAVYSTFCFAFPTSYKQFDSVFKEQLVQLVFLWMVGVKPVPNLWDKWKLDKLEPPDMRKDEKIKKDASKGSLVNLPVDSLNEESLNRQASLSKGLQKPLPMITEDRGSTISVRRDLRSRSIVSKLLGTNKPALAMKESSTYLTVPKDEQTELSSKMSDNLDTGPPMSATSRLTMRESRTSVLNNPNRTTRKPTMSCPVGKGPEFSRSVFDVHGRSPLVEQFLNQQRLAKDAGTAILVQRTEIKKLPPLGAETYQELIRKSLKASKEMGTNFKRLHEDDLKKRSIFAKKHKEGYQDYIRRQNDLLARQKEVKKISDLLVLELMKDGDEQSSGKAAAAIATAMGYTLPENN